MEPTIGGCPEQIAVGEPVRLTIFIAEGCIFGVGIAETSNADVVTMRVDGMEYTADVTPTVEGFSSVEFVVDATGGETRLGCDFSVTTNLGACCDSEGCADEFLEADCTQIGGEFQGGGSRCVNSTTCPDPARGACCNATECSDQLLEAECTQSGGEFLGGGTSCVDANTCQSTTSGACCIGDGTCAMASDQDQCKSFSDLLGGAFQGPRTVCEDVSCPVTAGACCLGDGRCVTAKDDSDCQRLAGDGDGVFHGPGMLCEDINCAPGACCIGDGSCVETAGDIECQEMAGERGGELVEGRGCEEVRCEVIVGACCIVEDDSCVEITREACIARSPELATTFQGVGRKCMDENGGFLCDNPAGACCSGGNCQVRSEENCAVVNGDYLGDHVLCVPEVAAMCEE